MATIKNVFTVGVLFLAAIVALPRRAMAADADPLVDFLIPGKEAQNVDATDFVSHELRDALMSNPAPGNQTIKAANRINFPALNTQGLSMVVLKFGPNGGQNAPHWHPRATEVFFLIKGEVEVTLVDTTNKPFTNTLRAGDITVFPRGLAHAIINKKHDTALAIAALNSANFGVLRIQDSLDTLKKATMN
eukprot:TRINITY_DN3003_c0_g1_i2.p1 TRINITY_DN3003_c0_g1~~TRINITY_DN3003_c0_g1_i2.p1  ORF type:complete len:219 (+),score=43.52 TRINITY_DN3003_c0_g1_i2:88-657(+)